ncbi:hypothetical protein [Rufibacter immobilis]|uniref:hypothetical protein n=1 Tax=Rufibacter immobilis TaxID=1348778 RepID=UPI0035EA552C
MGEFLELRFRDLPHHKPFLHQVQLILDAFQNCLQLFGVFFFLLVQAVEGSQKLLLEGCDEALVNRKAVKQGAVGSMYLLSVLVHLAADFVALVVKDSLALYLIPGHVRAAGGAFQVAPKR